LRRLPREWVEECVRLGLADDEFSRRSSISVFSQPEIFADPLTETVLGLLAVQPRHDPADCISAYRVGHGRGHRPYIGLRVYSASVDQIAIL
jgi:hypothetical protein